MKKLEQIDYSPLYKMSSVWSDVVKETFKTSQWLVLLLVVLLAIASLILFRSIELPIYGAVFVFAWLGGKVLAKKNAIWRKFAEANGWYVIASPKVSIQFVPPGIFGMGRRQKLSDIVHAEFEGHQCDVFMYQFTIGSGKNSKTYYYTVARVLLERPFPHLILDSKKSWALRQRGSATDKVVLEGNFDKYFSLYFNKGEHIDALSIITPDVMQTLINSNAKQDIEIIGNNLFFMMASDERSMIGMQALLTSVDALADEIAHKAKTIRYDQAYTANMAAIETAATHYFKSGDEVLTRINWVFWVIVLLPAIIGVLVGFVTFFIS